MKVELKELLVFSFQAPSEMGKNGITVRYTERMTLLNMFKVTVDMD